MNYLTKKERLAVLKAAAILCQGGSYRHGYSRAVEEVRIEAIALKQKYAKPKDLPL